MPFQKENRMNAVEALAACAGNWRATNTLQDPHAGRDDESPSAEVVSKDNTGVTLTFTWSYTGAPQQGPIVFTSDGAKFIAIWTDTWHTGYKPMACTGPIGDELSFRGSYPAPPGPDWGWRIDLVPETDWMQMVMWNVWPVEHGAREELAVEAMYARE
jgi:hypothetical protein